MRKTAFVAVTAVLWGVLLPRAGGAQIFGERFYVQAELLTGKSVTGTYTAQVSTPDMLEPGSGFGAGVGVELTPHYRIASSLAWLALPFKKDYRPNKLWRPTFEVPAWTFINILQWRLGRVTLELPLGVGIYFWRFTENGRGSDALQFEGQALEKMSFGINAGAGLEMRLVKSFRLFVAGTYHYILSQDRFLFGENFSEQGVFVWKSGLRWYFWQRNPLKVGKF